MKSKASRPYHLVSAKGHLLHLREQALIKVAESLRAQKWTQAQAARYLGVSQPRISDIMRGKDDKFSLDTLVEMLAALNLTVKLVVEETTAHGLDMRAHNDFELLPVLEHYGHVLELEPTSSLAYSRRAKAYWKANRLEEALADLDRAIALDADLLGPRENRAVLLGKLGRKEEALAELAQIEQKFPSARVDNNRALLLSDLGRTDEALECLNAAVARDSSRPGPFWNRAVLLESMGRLEEAMQDFQATLDRDPTYQPANERLTALRGG